MKLNVRVSTYAITSSVVQYTHVEFQGGHSWGITATLCGAIAGLISYRVRGEFL